MSKPFATRVITERLDNGIDVVFLPTPLADVVVCRIALGLGAYETYLRPVVALLLSDLLPSGVPGKKRTAVREAFELLGADVGVHVGDTHLYATLTSRSAAFADALTLLMRVLTTPVFTDREYAEAQTRIATILTHDKEDTDVQAACTLDRAQYMHGHPHWSPSTDELLHDVGTIRKREIEEFHTRILTGVGGVMVIAGDITPKTLMPRVRRACTRVPERMPERAYRLRPGRVRRAGGKDLVISLGDKMNVDMYLGIPLTLTRDHTDFDALGVGTAILGGSSSSRLFNELRTKQSLTYGAYAALGGFEDGYPGYLRAHAIFPNNVFRKGRKALRDVVRTFLERGVTARELATRTEELVGRYTVGLSTTRGCAGAVFGTLLSGKPVSYVDDYPARIRALSVRHVNRAIQTHVAYADAVTAAAGGVGKAGTPIA